MKILTAEDDMTSRRMLGLILGQLKYEVIETVNGQGAWEALNDIDPPTIAVIDWMMPRLDGCDLCRKLRARPNAAPLYIIMLTCKSGKDDIAKALGSGADDYIVKPFNVNELKARLKRGEQTVALQLELVSARREIQRLQAVAPAPRSLMSPPPLPRAIPLGTGTTGR